MGDFLGRKLHELDVGDEFIASDFFGKMIGIVEPGQEGELIQVSIDGDDHPVWWDRDEEVVIPA